MFYVCIKMRTQINAPRDLSIIYILAGADGYDYKTECSNLDTPLYGFIVGKISFSNI